MLVVALTIGAFTAIWQSLAVATSSTSPRNLSVNGTLYRRENQNRLYRYGPRGPLSNSEGCVARRSSGFVALASDGCDTTAYPYRVSDSAPRRFGAGAESLYREAQRRNECQPATLPRVRPRQ